MQKQIDEVMGLVDLACKNHADAALGGIKAYEAIHSYKDAIEAKLRELLPVWHPIESSPQNGVHILVRSRDITAIAFWDRDLEKWLEAWDGDEEFHDLCKPTHWMPLPKAPE